MTHDEMIEVISAYRDGKPIQYRHRSDAWGLQRTWAEAATPIWNFQACDYRIKPSPAKRLLRPDELPAVFWVKLKNEINADVSGYSRPWHLVTMAEERGSIWYFEGEKRVNVTKETHDWSPDRKFVLSFYTEEA